MALSYSLEHCYFLLLFLLLFFSVKFWLANSSVYIAVVVSISLSSSILICEVTSSLVDMLAFDLVLVIDLSFDNKIFMQRTFSTALVFEKPIFYDENSPYLSSRKISLALCCFFVGEFEALTTF